MQVINFGISVLCLVIGLGMSISILMQAPHHFSDLTYKRHQRSLLFSPATGARVGTEGSPKKAKILDQATQELRDLGTTAN